MNNVEFKSIETHVEAFIYDPFPTTVNKRYNGCTIEAIVAAMVEEYRDDLIALVVYDISVATINGVKYKSEPLNKTKWTRK